MIDLHTHTILSDGELLPSEMVRCALSRGYKTIALTDHVDPSNIDFVLPRLVKVSKVLNRFWDITVLPGVEITHVPIEVIGSLVKYARSHGAQVIVGHGETSCEPVIQGTNKAAIRAGVDILAHPGRITEADALLAKKKGVLLEITARASHAPTNRHLIRMARSAGARLVLNTDSHSSKDLLPKKKAESFLKRLGLSKDVIGKIFNNSNEFIAKKTKS